MPTGLRVYDAGVHDGLRLELTAPQQGFAYDVTVGKHRLPRWNTPFVRPGKRQVIPLRDVPLTPGGSVEVSVVVLNRIGGRSTPVRLRGRIPEPRRIAVADVPPLRSAGPPPDGLAVIPLLDRYTRDGAPVGKLPTDYRQRNAVFDGKRITLAAARGEVVGFQALVAGDGKVGVSCALPGLRTDIFRALYVDTPAGRVPDPLVRCAEADLSPSELTPVCVDVYVPFEFKGHVVSGSFSLSDGRHLPIQLRVRDFSLPRKASFLCEMNSYGLPNRVSEFYRLQQVAYDHRVHANILHYSHRTAAPGARKCNMDMLMSSGRRMDERRYNDIKQGATTTYWKDFVDVFDPYLSGRCFADGHRGPIPAPGFYLTFHESWPLSVRAYFDGNPDAYLAFRAQPSYARTFTSMLSDFASLARERGWRETGFQVYLNNKGSMNDLTKNPWVLDEPTAYWDYRALAFYDDLVRRGRGDATNIRYRIDISRPQFARGELDGKTDLWVCATGAFRKYRRLVNDRCERTGEDLWLYGTTSQPHESSRATAAWVLEAYRDGATGVVPWQTVNRDGKALVKGDQLGLFIFAPGGNDDDRQIYHSLRLKAYRRAQQDIEYLELLRRKLSLTPEAVARFIDRYVGIDGEQSAAYAEDAGTSQYGPLDPEPFRRLREASAELLKR